MATLHFFGGEKGGVGKSLVTRTAIQYHLDREIPFSAFDADQGNPDVKQIYQNIGCQDAIFSENKKYVDKAIAVYLAAQQKTTLVNLPAHITSPLKTWFEKNRVFDFSESERVEITHWFVCNGGYASLKIFGEYLDYFGGKINHVLVKNLGLCDEDEWGTLEDNESLMDKIDRLGVKIVNFPEFFGKPCCNIIEEKRLPFGVAKEFGEFNLFDRQRVKTFLAEAYQAFDEAGVFYHEIEVGSNGFSARKPSDSAKLIKLPKGADAANGKGKGKMTSGKEVVSEQTNNSVGAH